MTPTSWIRLCLTFSVFASAFVVPYDGQSDIPSLPARQQSVPIITPDSVGEVVCPRSNPHVPNGTLIDQLWKRNCDVVNKFLNNTFSVAQAEQRADATFESFQYYSVQDYYYLLETIPHEAFLMTTLPPASEQDLISNINKTIRSMEESLQFADDFRQNLTNRLNVSDPVISDGTLQAAGLGYVKWLQGDTDLGWFAFQVSRIPCIYGWAELANSLNQHSQTNKTSTFYKEWIQLNLDWSWGLDLSKKLQEAVDSHNNSENFEIYNRLFRQGMSFEIAFFESAMGKSLGDTVGGAY